VNAAVRQLEDELISVLETQHGRILKQELSAALGEDHPVVENAGNYMPSGT